MAPENKTHEGYRSTRAPPGIPPSTQTPGTPPDSPHLSPSAPFTLKDAQQFIDLVKAVVAMHTAPTITPKCSCSQTPLNSPAIQTPSPAVTLEDLKQLLLELVQAKSKSPESTTAAEPDKPDASEQAKTEIVRASKPEFKTVNEVWDGKEHAYKIVDSVKPVQEADKLDEYVFVVRMRIDKKSGDPSFHIDIKSEQLQEILEIILCEVKGICLGGDKPTVERNLLYNYLTELEAYQSTLASDPDTSNLVHLDLLINYIKEAYKSTTQHLAPLLERGEITYDLLWALFTPNSVAYTTCSGTKKSRCIRYDFGEEKTVNSVEYFHIEGRYWDFDGEVFGEAIVAAGISKFRGAKPIRDLGIFPLKYHENEAEIKAKLIKRGRQFIFLKGTHHLWYKGWAFRMEKGEPDTLSVDSRIMVDAVLFRKMQPNYTRPSINVPIKHEDGIWLIDLWEINDNLAISSDQVKSNTKDLEEVDENDLLLCSPTVLGFSLNDKIWLEFAIANISEITWDPLLFGHLEIPQKKKQLIQALTKSHVTQTNGYIFDDFVAGKGRGLIMLLYGPAGVGKTLTVEAVSEHLQRPLYVVSAGDLSSDSKLLERQLSDTFELADHWKAVLLLDEADVYLRQRSHDHLHNSLVSVFLRKLEYYQGIMFLTTNRLTDFDEAILSRIHLTLKYVPLNMKTRKGIWQSFLERAITDKGAAIYSLEQLDKLALNKFNGREIKNAIKAAYALATEDGVQLSYSHLQVVIDSVADLESDFVGGGQIESLRSYI